MTPKLPRGQGAGLKRHVQLADIRSAAQLVTRGTQGVIDIAEGVHQAVRRQLGLPAGATASNAGGLTGHIYQAVRGTAGVIGHGADRLLAVLLPLVEAPGKLPPPSPEREAVLAALNGVVGDRLQAMGNPLAQTMELRYRGRPLPAGLSADVASLSGHVLVLAHGLCMNDNQWCRSGHDHGAFLAEAMACTPVYLRYNSGLHTSVNGRELAGLIEQMVNVWPVPLERITLLGHSMGGLVLRSAVEMARSGGAGWPALLKDMVFLGTPHHGAPLEKAGHGVDLLLAATPYTAPFVRLGKVRSAGITDLRHGFVQDVDWQGHDLFSASGDTRQPLPLPPGVECFAVGATLAGQRSRLADRLTGDGLVPLDSALGRHRDPARNLAFDADHQQVVYRTGHLDLLSSQAVADQLVTWLGRVKPRA